MKLNQILCFQLPARTHQRQPVPSLFAKFLLPLIWIDLRFGSADQAVDPWGCNGALQQNETADTLSILLNLMPLHPLSCFIDLDAILAPSGFIAL